MSGRAINPLFATTTPIRYEGGQRGGTGFFLNHADRTHIVTNRHVVDPEDISPEQARIWFRNYGNITQMSHYDISLGSGEGHDWYGHPQSSDIDIAIIPLNQKLSSLNDISDGNHVTGSLSFTRQHYIHQNIGVDNRVTILGYPGDFVDRTTLFPVKRNALIASPYGQPFSGNPYFVTDARMHPGTSGSPVIMETGGMMKTQGEVPENRIGKGTYLLGVHSATFYRDDRENTRSESQYWETKQDDSNGDPQGEKYELNVAWYPELIDQILDSI
jgi:V8-like Glu-specific endopeptidase